jgi:dihydroorotate dehydrogenase (NAD+) catalytic subunit
MPNTQVSIAGVALKNPLVLASGVRSNTADLLIRAAEEGAGAVTSKSCSVKPREGYANPTGIIHGNIMMNAIGLSNPGAQAESEEIARAVGECRKMGVPVIASIFGNTTEDYAEAAKIIGCSKPALIEVNASCPHQHRDGKMTSADPELTTEVTKAVKRAATIPVAVKLSPNVTNVAAIAKAAQAGGADIITAINTVGGMLIDPYARRPILANKVGGLSGPAIKPIALKAVYEIRRAVEIPIIGGGGITCGTDAAEMLMAGADAVSVGSAVCLRQNAFGEILAELSQFMEKEGYEKISEIKLEE